LRASSPLAIGDLGASSKPRAPRATIGRLLAARGPDKFAEIIGELADGAIIDSRILMADRFGADEDAWPPPADRFASDLLRTPAITDAWLRALTASAASSAMPIALGAHTLVGPGVRLLVRNTRQNLKKGF
jgi:hypothetical protein